MDSIDKLESDVPLEQPQVDVQTSQPEPFRMPLPHPPEDVDPQVYEAWKVNMIEGYQHNSEMFTKVLDAFMRPYWLTVWMYRLMFFVGIAGFVLAVALGVTMGIEFAALFGGLTAVSFLGYFVSRPLQSLEQNIMFITWLGVVYNTYWTQLMYTNDVDTIQADLESITKTTVEQVNQLLDKHAELSGKRAEPSS